jgi:AcrR family transcriptional regulator
MALDQAELTTPLLPPGVDSDGTLRRIYEQALILFADRGYHGVSMREIAQACGIKASSIYAHLASKEQLLYVLVLKAHEEHRDLMREALLGAGAEPADQLRALVSAHVRFHAEYAVLATVGNNEMRALSAESISEIQAIRDEDLRVFTEVIERGVKLGRFSCPDPLLATAIIGSAGIRVAVWFPIAGALFGSTEQYTADHIADAYAEFALKMVS